MIGKTKERSMKRGRKTTDIKRSVKHAVFSVYIIDELIKNEENTKKLELLKKLRKEAVKVWQQ